jgi:prolyl-tRNA synthetase
MSTSHELGQNFAKVFDTMYINEAGEREFVWQTSWGASTRLMGALIMAHGDDAGLQLPPRLAPTQVAVVLVRDEDGAGDRARAIVSELQAGGARVALDDRVDQSFGRRAVDWELKGVPVRVEVGPRELKNGEVTVVRRDTAEKAPVAVEGAARRAMELLDEVQASMLALATTKRDDRIHLVESLDDAREASATGWAVLPWAKIGEAGETELNGKGVSVRCLRGADGELPVAADIDDNDSGGLLAYVGRAY